MNKFRVAEYEQRIINFEQKLSSVKKKHGTISFIRLGVFVAFLISWTWIFINNHTAGAVLGSLLLILFLALLKVHKKLEDEKNYLQGILEVNKREKNCCEGDFSVFDKGTEFIDSNHPYTYDIDLFGSGSLFQYLNRTITFLGKQKLTKWLLKTPLSNKKIIENQQAASELTANLDFRHEFLTTGELYRSDANELKPIEAWIMQPSFFKRALLTRVFLIILPTLNFAVLAGVIIGYFYWQYMLFALVFTLLVVGTRIKTFNARYQIISNCHLHLKKMSRLFSLIENLDLSSIKLKNEKSKLFKNSLPASVQINKLTRLLDGLDNRNNLLIGAVLNGLLMWDWQYILRIDHWKENHKVDFQAWMECIAYYDAIISLANLSFNNPDFTFPDISSQEYELSLTDVGHPLLDKEIRVCNQFNIDSKQRYAIITGANMAGKSTFLRTVAVNLILAGAGAAVCAKQMSFTPLPLFSSMRAEDSLMKNESYFFAELKRLQRITQELDKGKKLFIILDEILRGTNSEDKRKGSIGFVKKITEKLAHGLVATHDLELARLAEQQPEIFKALCFEVAFENNELQFDYKLQAGVTQNMNASFLMHRMGIID